MTAGRSQILIALIGLVGVLTTGVLSNWDKLFSHVVTVSYQGYKPTGDFETELRYFFEITGRRKTGDRLIEAVRSGLISANPQNAEKINQQLNAASETALTSDETLAATLPIYAKYYTVAEIQELNKFYSTEIMQEYLKREPLLQEESWRVIAKLTSDRAAEIRKQKAISEKPPASAEGPAQLPTHDH
jgi:hypothetical protein